MQARPDHRRYSNGLDINWAGSDVFILLAHNHVRLHSRPAHEFLIIITNDFTMEMRSRSTVMVWTNLLEQ